MRILALILFVMYNGLCSDGRSRWQHSRVLDPSGAAVANANIAARNLDTGFERQTTSTSSGEFDLPLLTPGRYEISVTANGFSSFKQTGVIVQLSKPSTLDMRMALASAQQTVTVGADATVLNTATAEVIGDMNAKAMENMPITTRNTFNLALFAPGFNGRRDDEFGKPTFAFGGMQRRAFLIDGIDNTQRADPAGSESSRRKPCRKCVWPPTTWTPSMAAPSAE